MDIYRPAGLEWFNEGFWAINDNADTAKQFLDTQSAFVPDNTAPLNIVNDESNGIYHIYDPGYESTHKAITLDAFKSMEFDFVIASIPQHIHLYQKLINQYQPKAKLIVQVGNNWSSNIVQGLNVLASVKPGLLDNSNVVYYHQEFDIDIFKPLNYKTDNSINSYINILQNMNQGWRDFTNLENLLVNEVKFNSYGGQCRDGSIAGASLLADSMNRNSMIFHVKDGGDGYGHILYNAYACGKPVIIRNSMYDNCLGQELFNDESSINLDGISIEDAAHKVRKILSDEELLNSMSIKAYETFKNNVDFAYDAEKVYNWMGTL